METLGDLFMVGVVGSVVGSVVVGTVVCVVAVRWRRRVIREMERDEEGGAGRGF